MNKLKALLVALGVVASSIIVTTMGDPCPITHTKVFVAQESVCVLKTHKNLKAALYADLMAVKTDENGKSYDIEIGNWEIFWKTLEKEVKARGMTAEEFTELAKGNKQVIIDILNPNL